ncbi:unnamed protein product, partial [Mesorhabditis belari]|uniref:BPTI/Kunitz inhibitor domain-containing protein n=1 Tax=Mesorhabditis belari TaxID=2138241 RepID=A0AAF3EE63_9BILA
MNYYLALLLAPIVFTQMAHPRGHQGHRQSHEYYSHERHGHHNVPERCRITRENSQQPHGAICLPQATTYYFYDIRAEECRSEINWNSCQLPYQFLSIHDCEHHCRRRH